MTKPADIRAKTSDELDAMLLDLRKEQFNLRFQRAAAPQERTDRIRVVRRDIARVKTILRQKAAPPSRPRAAAATSPEA